MVTIVIITIVIAVVVFVSDRCVTAWVETNSAFGESFVDDKFGHKSAMRD